MTTAAPGILSRARNIVTAISNRVRGVGPREVPTINSRAFQQYAGYFRRRTGELADQLVAGSITIDEWQAAMRQELNKLHTTAYVVGKGGFDNLDQDDLQQIDRLVARQQGFLDQWADQMRDGRTMTAEGIKARANMYLNNATSTLQQATTEALGMPPLPAYPKDGSAPCRTNDKCRWEIRKVGPNDFDAYWRLAPAEHCEVCVRRSQVWNPLQIRNGVILPYNNAGLIR